MAKSPRNRHSKGPDEPVTIDLVADAVTESAESSESGADAAEARTPPEEIQAATETITETVAAHAAEASDPAPAAPAGAERTVAPPPARRGVGALVAAGLIGGVAATGGNWVYDRFIQAPATPAQPALDIAAELAARDGRIGELAAAVQAAKADMEALKGTLAGSQPGEAPDLAPLVSRLEALEKQFAGLAQAGGDPAAAAKFAEVEAKLAELAATASTASDAARQAAETATAQAARVDALAAAVKAVEEQAAASGANPKIAIAIAAAALKSAVDRGQPFMSELETYAAVAPDAPEIASLRDFAAAGVPTLAALAVEAAGAAEAMIAVVNAPDPNAGFFQRLLDSAKALVSVRPIGMVEGDSIEAIAARTEAKAKSGDLKGALDELARAPESAKAAAAAFAARVQGRLTVENLIDKALAAALAPGGNG